MSYQINISGHSSELHNAEVREIAEEAVRRLHALPGSTQVHLSGYATDSTGSITLSTPPDIAEDRGPSPQAS